MPILTTWRTIQEYLHLSRYQILRRGYPVYILPTAGSVYADTDALDRHSDTLMAQAELAGQKERPPSAERS